MSEYILSCSSSSDLSKDDYESRDIHYISNYIQIDGVRYKDCFDESVSINKLYKALRDGSKARVSHINVDSFVEYFEPFLRDGKDVLHVTLSSGLSDTYNNAIIAKRILDKKYPASALYIVDSMAASTGYGLIMETLADRRDGGADIKELYRWIIDNRLNMQHILCSSSISKYHKGSKVSKRRGFINNAAMYCRFLYMNYLGELIVRGRIRGKNNALKLIVERAVNSAGDDYSGRIIVSNSDCKKDAKHLADMLKKRFPKMRGEVEIRDIGSSLCAHSGPDTLAVYLWGRPRVC